MPILQLDLWWFPSSERISKMHDRRSLADSTDPNLQLLAEGLARSRTLSLLPRYRPRQLTSQEWREAADQSKQQMLGCAYGRIWHEDGSATSYAQAGRDPNATILVAHGPKLQNSGITGERIPYPGSSHHQVTDQEKKK